MADYEWNAILCPALQLSQNLMEMVRYQLTKMLNKDDKNYKCSKNQYGFSSLPILRLGD